MEYSEKFLILAGYLGLDEESYDEIEEVSDSEFEYNGDTYKILSENELNEYIEDYTQMEIEETQRAINKADLSDLNIDYTWNMELEVDYDYIRKNVEENYADFIGTGTVEKFEGHYIFLM